VLVLFALVFLILRGTHIHTAIRSRPGVRRKLCAVVQRWGAVGGEEGAERWLSVRQLKPYLVRAGRLSSRCAREH
jgi:hypothetical protein